jgi:predicted subunit of tRNA(5-methylaminomethyl-2-thiouridylate) methyltransferase
MGYNELVLLFSGGTDSTYTAVLMSQQYPRIHLITYDRFGFLNTQNSFNNALALKEKFGESKFTHQIINIDDLYKKVAYDSYIRDIFKYRFFLLLTCGLCKLAMHWQTILYCLDNRIKSVCDGSNQEMAADPSQDRDILKEMKILYKEFGIDYFTPIFDTATEIREKTVFDLGFFPVQKSKLTRFSWEKQPYCTQEYLFIKFFNYACTDWNGRYSQEKAERYNKRMLEYHRKKRDFIRDQIYTYLKKSS